MLLNLVTKNWFYLDCIMQLKQLYYIATNVCSRKSATTFGDLPDCYSLCIWKYISICLNIIYMVEAINWESNTVLPLQWIIIFLLNVFITLATRFFFQNHSYSVKTMHIKSDILNICAVKCDYRTTKIWSNNGEVWKANWFSSVCLFIHMLICKLTLRGVYIHASCKIYL